MLRIPNRFKLKAPVAAACLLLFASGISASTITSNFTTQIAVTASCTITTASTLDFGSAGVLSANVDQTATIQIQCTDSTPYNIGLDAGSGPGATVSTRKMSNGGNTVTYTLYTDSARTTIWGDTVGTDTLAANGNGGVQTYTLYGRVAPQSTPAPGTYTDTVTVTVTY